MTRTKNFGEIFRTRLGEEMDAIDTTDLSVIIKEQEFELAPFLIGLELDERSVILQSVPFIVHGANEIDIAIHTGIDVKVVYEVLNKYREIVEWRNRVVSMRADFFRQQMEHLMSRSLQVVTGLLAEDWRKEESASVKTTLIRTQAEIAMGMLGKMIDRSTGADTGEPKKEEYMPITNASARIVAQEIVNIKDEKNNAKLAIMRARAEIEPGDTPQYGRVSIDFNNRCLLCHECGNWIPDSLYEHIESHDMTTIAYMQKHGIEDGLSFDEQVT